MINYRIDNIEALVKELKQDGINVLDEIELWEPVDAEFEKTASAITK